MGYLRTEGARAKLYPCEMNSPLVFCKEDKRLAYYGDALREDHFSERLIRASVPFWSKMHKWLRC